jgi:hypothetical protein
MSKIRISQEELAERFDEVLDEAGEVKVSGYTFNPSKVLKECDPTAYRCELANFASMLEDCGFEITGN